MITCVDGCLDFVCDPCATKVTDEQRAIIALNTEGTAIDGDCYRGYWADAQLGTRFWQIDGQARTNVQIERARQFAKIGLRRIEGAKVKSEFRDGAVCTTATVNGEAIEAIACRRRCF